MKDALLAVGLVVVLAVVSWLCEKYRPAIVLGGILLIIIILT